MSKRKGNKPTPENVEPVFSPVALAVIEGAYAAVIEKQGHIMVGPCRAAAYSRINFGLRAAQSGNVVALALATCGKLPAGGSHVYQATATQMGVTYEGAGAAMVATVAPDSPMAAMQANDEIRVVFNSNPAWHKCTYTGLVAGSEKAAQVIAGFIDGVCNPDSPGDAELLKQFGQATTFATAARNAALAAAAKATVETKS